MNYGYVKVAAAVPRVKVAVSSMPQRLKKRLL